MLYIEALASYFSYSLRSRLITVTLQLQVVCMLWDFLLIHFIPGCGVDGGCVNTILDWRHDYLLLIVSSPTELCKHQ